MNSLFKVIFMFLIVVLIGTYLLKPSDEYDNRLALDDRMAIYDAKIEGIDYKDEERPTEGVSLLIGENKQAVIDKFGQPSRIDPSPFGYDWLIYNDDEHYLQVGVDDDIVVTVYVYGSAVNVEPFNIGQTYGEIHSSIVVEPEVALQIENSSYKFELSEEDMNTRPLIQMGNIFAQLYIDRFTGLLSSVRFVDGPTLIKQRSYELVYRGQLYNVEPLNDEQWELVEAGTKQQIFDLTNEVRKKFSIQELVWNEDVADVAYSHSNDMSINNYFDHVSPDNGDLADRLDNANILYELAGENIIYAQHIDAPEAIESWMNSKSHRETMLEKEFSQLGVGVYKNHYTQNFIKQWSD